MDFVGIFLSAMLVAATPILLAALGELVTEKAGVINLGIEGLMLIGAVAGFATASTTGISLLGVFTAAIASVMAAGIFIFLTQFLKTNQIATGLAMTIFGIGLSSLLGKSYVGVTIEKIPSIPIPLLHKIPLLGDFLFNHDILVYFSIIAVFLVHFFLSKTRAGMILKAVGENHTTATIWATKISICCLLPILLEGTRMHIGVLITPIAFTWIWLMGLTTHPTWISSASHWLYLPAAIYAGFNPKKLLWISMLLGGGFAGLAGMMEVNGAVGQINSTFTTGYGYTAIIVAFLGRLHPVGIFFAGILMASSYLGGEIAQIELGFPKAVTGIFQGSVLFFLLTCDFFYENKLRLKLKK